MFRHVFCGEFLPFGFTVLKSRISDILWKGKARKEEKNKTKIPFLYICIVKIVVA